MKALICARAAVTRAVSLLLSSFGATSAANSAMMVSTTSISISVMPRRRACLSSFLMAMPCPFSSITSPIR